MPNVKALLEPIAWVLLGGLIVWVYQLAADQNIGKEATTATSPEQRSAARKAARKALLAAGPQTKTWQTPEGQVIELDVPSSSLGGLIVDVKRCIIWQGNNSTSPAMSCGNNADDPTLFPGDGPDNTPPYSF